MKKEYQYFSTYFIIFMTWGAVNSLITLYLNEVAGFSVATVGVFMSFMPLISLVFQPAWGVVSDMGGSRKKVLRLLLLVGCLISVLLSLLHIPWLVLVLFSLYTLFVCGQNPIMDSMSINFVNIERTSSFGSIRVWGSFGYALGSLVFAFVADYLGLSSIFTFAAILYAIGFFWIRSLNEYGLKTQKGNYLKDLSALLKNKDYVFILIYSFIIVGSFFGGEQFISLYIRSNGIEVGKLGILNFIAVCVEIPLIFYSRRLAEFFGIKKLLLFMNVMNIARMFLISISSSFMMFLGVGILRGLVVGIFIPLFVELIGDITRRELATSAISIYMAISTGVAVFFFTFIGSFVADQLGYNYLYMGLGIANMLPLLMLGKVNTNRQNVNL